MPPGPVNPFQILLSRERPIPDGIIRSAMNAETFTVPDNHYQPDIWVYFDFVRRVTATPQELKSGKLLNQVVNDTFATDRAIQRVEYYYKIFRDFAQAFGFDRSIPFLSGSQLPIAASAEAKQDFLNQAVRHFISNVSVRRTSTGPSTATVSITFPTMSRRSGLFTPGKEPEFQIDTLLFWNHFFVPAETGEFTVLDQLLTPMTWVYIYGRGRLDPANYYPVFTGLINHVTRSNQQGYESLEVVCEDALKPLHKTMMRVNPALAPTADANIQNIVGNSTAVTNHPLSGRTMKEVYSYIILGSNLGSVVGQPPFAVLDYQLADEPSDFGIYEARRKISYAGENPDLLAPRIRDLRRSSVMSPKLFFWGLDDINPYRAILPARVPTFFGSDFINRLEAVQEISKRTMTEFYADACGHYQAHPYRHAMLFLNTVARVNGTDIPDFAASKLTSAYVVSYDEMRSSSFTISDEEIATVLLFQGEPAIFGSTIPLLSVFGHRTVAVAQELGLRYGFWVREQQEQLVNAGSSQTGKDTKDAKTKTYNSLLGLYALARLAYLNKDLYSAQVTIVFRPELEVARPVYFPERRDIGYIISIDHNFPVGGDPTTGLGVSYVRKTDALPIDFTEFLIQRNTTITITQQEIDALITLFTIASGLKRTTSTSLIGSAQSPGAVLLNPTVADLLRAASKGTQDLLGFATEVADITGAAQVTAGLTGP